MKTERMSPDEAIGTCAWCGATIGDNAPVFAFGAKKRPGTDLSSYEGGAVRFTLVSQVREVVAIVPPEDSDARRDGRDLVFLVCTEACGAALKSALQVEVQLGNALFESIKKMGN